MDEFDTSLIDRLEETVENRHRSAMQAIRTLKDYLTDYGVSTERASQGGHLIGELIGYLHSKGSIRERVRQAILDQYKTIAQIADETGLTEVQIRGALYAKDLRENIRKDHSSGPVRFRLVSTGGA
jgi:hypothetical protein